MVEDGRIDLSELDLPQMPRSQQEYGDRGSVIDKTDPEKLILDIKHILKGEEKGDDGNWYVRDKATPLINDTGIDKLATYLRMIINKNTIFTKYSGDTIKNILIDIETGINDHIRANAKRYDISAQNFCIVVDMLIQPVEAAINRSRDGVTMDFVGNITRDTNSSSELHRPQQYFPQQSQGMIPKVINKFNPFK